MQHLNLSRQRMRTQIISRKQQKIGTVDLGNDERMKKLV